MGTAGAPNPGRLSRRSLYSLRRFQAGGADDGGCGGGPPGVAPVVGAVLVVREDRPLRFPGGAACEAGTGHRLHASGLPPGAPGGGVGEGAAPPRRGLKDGRRKLLHVLQAVSASRNLRLSPFPREHTHPFPGLRKSEGDTCDGPRGNPGALRLCLPHPFGLAWTSAWTSGVHSPTSLASVAARSSRQSSPRPAIPPTRSLRGCGNSAGTGWPTGRP